MDKNKTIAALPILTATQTQNAALVLANGSFYIGQGIGSTGHTDGELCFNTGMTGYQETITDPSYAGHLITFTFPHIGNVGTNPDDNEATTIACRGIITNQPITRDANYRATQPFEQWLCENNLTGITGIDTRQLTQRIRHEGASWAIIKHVSPGETLDIAAIYASLKNQSLEGQELAQTVTTQREYTWAESQYDITANARQQAAEKTATVVVLDFGAKHNILRHLQGVGLTPIVVPATTPVDKILDLNPDGAFLSNGPGDPAETGQYAIPTITAILEKKIPLFGICLGHQLLALASGLTTYKLPKGHRGANQPVHNLTTNRVEITSQNHGFCVSADNVPDYVTITHKSLFDQTIEGIALPEHNAFSVQYHPESSPGPHDSQYLFDQFRDLITQQRM